MDEQSANAILAQAAGLTLTAERMEALLPGIRRIQAGAGWLRTQKLGFTEPATVFDVLVRRSQ
jgi:hypothetical protein